MNENAGGLGSASLQTFHAPCLSASQTKEGSHHTAPLVKNCAPYYPRSWQAAEYILTFQPIKSNSLPFSYLGIKSSNDFIDIG